MEKNKFIVLSTILLQGMLIIILNSMVLISSSYDSIRNSASIFNIITLVLTIFIIVSFRKINDYVQKDVELQLTKSHLHNTEELIKLLRIQRHDHIKHIQTIQSMLFLGEYDNAIEYLAGIADQYRYTGELIRVGHPALTALLNTKKEMAEGNGLQFQIVSTCKIKNINIKSWDLCSIIGNLTDNAIEAVLESGEKGFVKIEITDIGVNYKITVENNGPCIKLPTNLLFQANCSTKGSEGRGYGLYIVKKLVDKYDGRIDVGTTQRKTTIFTLTLQKGEERND